MMREGLRSLGKCRLIGKNAIKNIMKIKMKREIPRRKNKSNKHKNFKKKVVVIDGVTLHLKITYKKH